METLPLAHSYSNNNHCSTSRWCTQQTKQTPSFVLFCALLCRFALCCVVCVCLCFMVVKQTTINQIKQKSNQTNKQSKPSEHSSRLSQQTDENGSEEPRWRAWCARKELANQPPRHLGDLWRYSLLRVKTPLPKFRKIRLFCSFWIFLGWLPHYIYIVTCYLPVCLFVVDYIWVPHYSLVIWKA